jgi:hypothetical protein
MVLEKQFETLTLETIEFGLIGSINSDTARIMFFFLGTHNEY